MEKAVLGITSLALFGLKVYQNRKSSKPAASDKETTEAILPSSADLAKIPQSIDAAFLQQYSATNRFRSGAPKNVTFTRDGKILFLRSGGRCFTQNLYEYDVETQKERVLLTADQVLKGGEEKLSQEEKALRERMRLSSTGIVSYQLNAATNTLLVPLAGKLFLVNRSTGKVRELPHLPGSPFTPRFSPDGSKIACVVKDDLYIVDVKSGEHTKLTDKPKDSKTISFGSAEFVAAEEMDRFEGFWWSPDSQFIACQETDTSGMETMHILDPAHPEQAPSTFAYPRPGMKNATVKLHVLAVDKSSDTVVHWNAQEYPYLVSVSWTGDAPITLVVQNRHQTESLVLAVDKTTGKSTQLLKEIDASWVNINQSVPHWLDGRTGFLWVTERNGWPQLELRGPTGQPVRVLHAPELGFRSIVHVDQQYEHKDYKGAVYITGGPEPSEQHIYRVPLHPHAWVHPQPELLTMEAGLHSATFAGSGTYWLNICDPLEGRPTFTVRDLRKSLRESVVGQLKSEQEAPPLKPRLHVFTANHPREYRVAVLTPRDFDASKKYPVILSVYGGPHHRVVVKSSTSFLLQQWLADHGFIVVSADGRGTPFRGREWERVLKGNFIQVPLNDQVEALQAVAKERPYMDMTRVGVFGWSFGGYFSAMAVMQRPEVFHAGFAGAPVAAWEDYDTHYTERYIGLPEENKAGYEDSSVLTHCSKLSRALLIAHGTADDNVYFSHAIKMSNSLFRAGKYHEFLPLCDFTHMVNDPVINTSLYSRLLTFFLNNVSRKKD